MWLTNADLCFSDYINFTSKVFRLHRYWLRIRRLWLVCVCVLIIAGRGANVGGFTLIHAWSDPNHAWSNPIHADPPWSPLIHRDPLWSTQIPSDPFWFSLSLQSKGPGLEVGQDEWLIHPESANQRESEWISHGLGWIRHGLAWIRADPPLRWIHAKPCLIHVGFAEWSRFSLVVQTIITPSMHECRKHFSSVRNGEFGSNKIFKLLTNFDLFELVKW